MSASEKLISRLKLDDSTAVILHNPSNMFWATEGYTGEGVVYLSGKQKVIVTDFRYTEQAGNQASAFRCVMVETGLSHNDWIAKLCAADGVTQVYFEDEYLTVKQFEALRDTAKSVRFIGVGQAPEKLREIKTEAEAANIREACRITSEAYRLVLDKIHEGMTEKELRIELDFLQLKLGARGNSFNTIIASGENGSLPHAIPGNRKLRKGDMITMDFGCIFNGYMSDMTRTVALGQPSETMKKVYDTVFEAQALGVSILAPGRICSDIDKQVRDFIDAAGYEGRFGHGLGHSVGIDIHENPRLSKTCHETVEVGHVLTVEPGIYLPGIGGVRIEDTCLVVPGGCEPLTTAPKALTIL